MDPLKGCEAPDTATAAKPPTQLADFAPELLVEIFKWCTPDSRSFAQPLRPYRWILLISLVCRYWREIALNNSLLWRTIDVSHSSSHPARFQEMSSRAGPEGSLGFVGLLDKSADYEAIWSLLPRTDSLYLRVDMSRDRSLEDNVIKSDAPILHALGMKRCGEEKILKQVPLVSPKYRLKFLECLDVSGYPYQTASQFFRRTLKHLRLTHPLQDRLGSSGPSVAQFLDALNGMPLLETLHFDTPFHKHTPQPADLSMAELRFLKVLRTINNHPLSTTEVLDHLAFPNISFFGITANESGLDSDLLPFVGSVLAGNGVGTSGPVIFVDTLFIHSTSGRTDQDLLPCFSAWSGGPGQHIEDEFYLHFTPPSGKSSFCYSQLGSTHVDAVLQTICSTSCDLRNIRHLMVDDPYHTYYALGMHNTWNSTFASLSGLESLFLSRTVWDGLGTLQPDKMPPFQRLQVLTLAHIAFRHTNPDVPSKGPLPVREPGDVDFIHVLREMLAARRKAGVGIKRLVIKMAYNFTPKDAEKLRKYVDQLEWDGRRAYGWWWRCKRDEYRCHVLVEFFYIE